MKSVSTVLLVLSLISLTMSTPFVSRYLSERRRRLALTGQKEKKENTISTQMNILNRQLSVPIGDNFVVSNMQFCPDCGAGIGKYRRTGEGTCPTCDTIPHDCSKCASTIG